MKRLILTFWQVDKSSRWSEETMLKEYKQKIVSRHSGNWTKSKFYSDEFIKSFQNARRSSFDIKKLTKSELDFLMEYICN